MLLLLLLFKCTKTISIVFLQIISNVYLYLYLCSHNVLLSFILCEKVLLLHWGIYLINSVRTYWQINAVNMAIEAILNNVLNNSFLWEYVWKCCRFVSHIESSYVCPCAPVYVCELSWNGNVKIRHLQHGNGIISKICWITIRVSIPDSYAASKWVRRYLIIEMAIIASITSVRFSWIILSFSNVWIFAHKHWIFPNYFLWVVLLYKLRKKNIVKPSIPLTHTPSNICKANRLPAFQNAGAFASFVRVDLQLNEHPK